MGPKRRSNTQPAATTPVKNTRSSSTQPSIDESFREVTQLTSADLKEQANDCIRFLIYKVGQQVPIRKTDIQKHIKGAVGRNFDKILEISSNILEKVYGFKIILCDGGSKCYILSNNLPHIDEDNDLSELPVDRHKILLMLILIHIYMSSNNVTQASLFSYLRSLHIDPEGRHEVFGNVKEYITGTLVKKRYLHAVKEVLSQDISYSWGERAEKEISKMELLNLVCKISKDNNPKSWVSQYKEATEQPLENHRNENMETEEVDDVE